MLGLSASPIPAISSSMAAATCTAGSDKVGAGPMRQLMSLGLRSAALHQRGPCETAENTPGARARAGLCSNPSRRDRIESLGCKKGS